MLKIAAVQMDVQLGDPASNLTAMLEVLQETFAAGVALTVFPECALTGYCFASREEAWEFAQTLPGPAVEAFTEVCRASGRFVAFGLLERDGDRLYNACALVGPAGLVARYRKIHLPRLGVDHFVDPGTEGFHVHACSGLRVGMHICYDGSFPEAARSMALDGADLLILPTNWPAPALNFARYILNARAMENHVYTLSANRVGTERGFAFIGHSRICDPFGNTLCSADHEQPAVLIAEVEPELPRQKRLVRQPGAHEIDRLRDRRPAFYTRLLSDYQEPRL